MGKKNAKPAQRGDLAGGDLAKFGVALKGAVVNLMLTVVSCAAVYGCLAAARSFA